MKTFLNILQLEFKVNFVTKAMSLKKIMECGE